MASNTVVVRPVSTEKLSFVRKLSVVLLLLLVSGLFSLSDDHRFGLPFLRELIISLSVLSFAYIYLFDKELLGKTEWRLVFLVLMLFFIPVIFSYFKFGQPVAFGMLEERRTLLYFSYFLFLMFIGKESFSENDIESILRYAFFITLIWSVASAFHIIPRNSGFEFSTNADQFKEGFVSDDSRYDTRFTSASILIFIYPIYLALKNKFFWFICVFSLAVLYMFFVNQTRTLSVMVFLSLILSWLLKRSSFNYAFLLGLFSFSLCFFYFFYLIYVFVFGDSVLFYDFYRNVEFSIVMREVLDNYFIPMGGVSLQFNRGFESIYGFMVFLSDIGVTGLVFKFGLFLIPLLWLKFSLLYGVYSYKKNDFSIILFSLFVVACIFSPFGDFLSGGSEEVAILLFLSMMQSNGGVTKYYMKVVRNVGGANNAGRFGAYSLAN